MSVRMTKKCYPQNRCRLIFIPECTEKTRSGKMDWYNILMSRREKDEST